MNYYKLFLTFVTVIESNRQISNIHMATELVKAIKIYNQEMTVSLSYKLRRKS